LARKILLADDSVTAQNMGRKILVDAGYDVLTVNNGSAALKRITETKPDLIILDVYMPGYSGLEVCQRLKDSAETANIPVLLSVGKLEPFKPQEARRVRANAHIVKPFEASELLSAIARLEDDIVPQAHKPAFCSPLPNAESFDEETYTKPDRSAGTGRKSGGRGSSKKKGSEAEAEDAVANFRDFRKAKEKSGEAGTSPAESSGSSAAQDAAAVPDMPRDITKEELDALSALAARLDGPVAESAPAEVAGSPAEPAQTSAESTNATLAHMDVASDSEKATETSITPAAEVPTETPTVAMPEAAEAAGASVVAGNEIETPVAQVEPASEVATVERAVVEPAAVEVRAMAPQTVAPQEVEPQTVEANTVEAKPVEPKRAEPKPVEFKAAEFAVVQDATAEPVNTGLFVQEAAPVDQQDEPMFASAVAEEKISPKVEAQESQTPGQAKAQKESAEEEKSARDKSEPVEAAPAVPIVAKVEEAVEAEAPAPTEEELAEALRLLTPATGYAEVASDGTSIADGAAAPVSAQTAGASLAHMRGEESGGETSARRWMAEAVALSPEETALSLEEEMFRTFAAAPAGEIEAAPAANRVSIIKAAVENRLAEAAKQAEPAAEEAPKAMAAAAATESSAPADSTKGSEEVAIAHIVDKVLADLRPKIVEEIARKLGKNG